MAKDAKAKKPLSLARKHRDQALRQPHACHVAGDEPCAFRDADSAPSVMDDASPSMARASPAVAGVPSGVVGVSVATMGDSLVETMDECKDDSKVVDESKDDAVPAVASLREEPSASAEAQPMDGVHSDQCDGHSDRPADSGAAAPAADAPERAGDAAQAGAGLAAVARSAPVDAELLDDEVDVDAVGGGSGAGAPTEVTVQRNRLRRVTSALAASVPKTPDGAVNGSSNKRDASSNGVTESASAATRGGESSALGSSRRPGSRGGKDAAGVGPATGVKVEAVASRQLPPRAARPVSMVLEWELSREPPPVSSYVTPRGAAGAGEEEERGWRRSGRARGADPQDGGGHPATPGGGVTGGGGVGRDKDTGGGSGGKGAARDALVSPGSGVYRCTVCGQIKKGHSCPGPKGSVAAAPATPAAVMSSANRRRGVPGQEGGGRPRLVGSARASGTGARRLLVRDKPGGMVDEDDDDEGSDEEAGGRGDHARGAGGAGAKGGEGRAPKEGGKAGGRGGGNCRGLSVVLRKLMAAGMVQLGETVEYRNKRGDLLLTGQCREGGIECHHCNNVLSLSQFEQHAGSTAHRPSEFTFLSNGRTLQECLLELEDTEQANRSAEGDGAHESDDLCRLCGEGGDLMCCDTCPSTFHVECLGLDAVPEGDWYCPSCCCSACGRSEFTAGEFNENTIFICDQCERDFHVKCLRRAGFQLDSNPPGTWFCARKCCEVYEYLSRLVGWEMSTPAVWKATPLAITDGQAAPPGDDAAPLALCPSDAQVGLTNTTSTVASGPSPSANDPENGQPSSKGQDREQEGDRGRDAGGGAKESVTDARAPSSAPAVKSSSIARQRPQKLVEELSAAASNHSGAGASKDQLLDDDNTPVTWVMMRVPPDEAASAAPEGTKPSKGAQRGPHEGLPPGSEAARLMKAALNVMKECFHPILDQRTKQDTIPLMMASRRTENYDYGGFCTFVLRRGPDVLCVALVRIFGDFLAEMPLIGTRFDSRKGGCARRLVTAIELVLHSLGVRKFVLPAVEETSEAWTRAFKFSPCSLEERRRHVELGVMVFPGTTMMEKPIRGAKLPAKPEDYFTFMSSTNLLPLAARGSACGENLRNTVEVQAQREKRRREAQEHSAACQAASKAQKMVKGSSPLSTAEGFAAGGMGGATASIMGGGGEAKEAKLALGSKGARAGGEGNAEDGTGKQPGSTPNQTPVPSTGGRQRRANQGAGASATPGGQVTPAGATTPAASKPGLNAAASRAAKMQEMLWPSGPRATGVPPDAGIANSEMYLLSMRGFAVTGVAVRELVAAATSAGLEALPIY